MLCMGAKKYKDSRINVIIKIRNLFQYGTLLNPKKNGQIIERLKWNNDLVF